MNVGEYCFAALLQQCVRPLSEPTHKRDNDRFDELTQGLVLVAAENGELLRNSDPIGKQFNAIRRIFDLKANDDWLAYERIPFDAAAALIDGCLPQFLDDSDFISLLRHPLSGVRFFCCRLAWLMRDHLQRDDVVRVLLANVANKLGHVEQSAGLARSFFEKPGEFFEVATAYTPSDERFIDQYDDRIAELQEGNKIELILSDLVSSEARLRKRLSQHLFSLSLPDAAPARSPQQLAMPLHAPTPPSENIGTTSVAAAKVAICEHLKDPNSWPTLKGVLNLYESSHLDYGVARCEGCNQPYLTCFWEIVDFEGGNDLMWSTRMPLSEEEVSAIERLHRDDRQSKDYLIAIAAYFEHERDKLVWHPDGRYETMAVCPMQIAARVADELP